MRTFDGPVDRASLAQDRPAILVLSSTGFEETLR